jgi:hypothetical protein
MVGLVRIELTTSRLSGVRSSQLSYRPEFARLINKALSKKHQGSSFKTGKRFSQQNHIEPQIPNSKTFPFRKEVIQPQVLLRLPCYDFTPITNPTCGACLPYGLAQRLLVKPTFVV